MQRKLSIYPIPHELVYHDGILNVDRPLNLVLDTGLDQETINKIREILQEHEVTYTESQKLASDQINIGVGIKGSGSKVDQYISKEIGYHDSFEKIDAHQLEINEQGIFVLGKDTDSSFYGLVTLTHILEQVVGLQLPHLSIKDYSDTKIRGVIEGFYGIPWGNKKRADLIKFGGKFKSNVFIFAPKDDPYHREKWRELYPTEELEEIRKLAHLGNAEKNRYVWTIAPFKPGAAHITAENIKKGIEDLIAKFEQLYAADVRQFGVLGDDVGELPKDTVVDVMNAVSEWAKEKGDIYDFVFVPQGYVLADWGFNGEELDTYDVGFPEDVHIMFTGDETMAPVTQEAINGFKTKKTTLKERRDPLFWLNWPVNDIDREDYRRLFIGKGEMLIPKVTNLIGVLTNPMEESQPSKNAIFATCDYAWNIRDFDAETSWLAGFKYFEPDTPNELHEIAKHMTSMNETGIENLTESEELDALINAFKESLDLDSKSMRVEAKKVEEYFALILRAVDTFRSKSQQETMKIEMAPYLNSLYDKSLVSIKYLQILEVIEDTDDITQVQQLVDEAKELKKQSQSYTVHTKTAEFPALELRAESGTAVINPFIDFIENYVEKKMKVY